MKNITIDDFVKIEMKIGTILVAEYIEGADKLLRLEVDFGPAAVSTIEFTGTLNSGEDALDAPKEEVPEVRDIRQILSGIREYYEPEQLIGKQCPFVTNLAPRKMRGLESHGMILAVGMENSIALLSPDKAVAPGSGLR
jgi:methionyl-tRNA synthetase